MIEIQKPNRKTLFLIKSFISNKKTYKKSVFTLAFPFDEGYLLHHTFTKQLLFLTPEEYRGFFSSDYARDYYYAVPSSLDEIELVDMIRDMLLPSVSNPMNHSSRQYLIFTTTCCNARCPYCYEIGHHSNTTMSLETAERSADFILKNTLPNQEIVLSWMGGEPLLNVRAIDLICKRIADSGRAYSSKMATNAYLLDEALIQKAKHSWNLKKVQFTLDGTEEVYNRIKGYVGVQKESPFRVVLRNMKAAVDADIIAELHLNTSEENCEDILNLVHFLHECIGKRDNFLIKENTLIERTPEKNFRRSEEDQEYLYRYVDRIVQACREYGFSDVPELSGSFRIFHCNAYCNNQISILPDGHVGMCDQVLDGHFIGSVDSTEFDKKEIAYYKIHMPLLPECSDCPLYPDCIRLSCCLVDVPWCSPIARNAREKKIYESMAKCYSAFREKNHN